MPCVAVKESKERVLAVLKGFDCDFPIKRRLFIYHLRRGRKSGPLFDVTMAVAMLRS
ncbi:magnesium chelatase domain-containing protein [Bacillus marinisedimentorum]|uniref:magnesium chelatase domain-containing protein n=1 Tax=Bacillus marinisedimentorum TaxID=1821260 RepID=UPI001B80D01D|nr:magnesium chelatase domain-containing protein [Bacillus marinisedimentorum]